MHGLPLHKFFGQVIIGPSTDCFKPLQVLFQDLECTGRVMFHTVNLDLDLVHVVRYLLLHSRLLHLAFQCLYGF